MSETIAIRTTTRTGQLIELREMRLWDAAAIRRCVSHPQFRLPYLTGTPDPATKPVRPGARSADFALKAMASRFLGRLAFGARRHWLVAITDARTGQFLGAAMLDGVVRFPRRARPRLLERALIEPHKIKDDEQAGDAEWGFFLHPDYWGQGIALQAIYALTATLADKPSWCAPGQNVVRRIWAETGVDNGRAITLLEKAGLTRNLVKTIPASISPRFEPDGRLIALLHFDQPDNHLQTNADAPVKALLEDMERRRVVTPGWTVIRR